MERVAVKGFVAREFRAVKEEFARNFTERGDVGAAVSVFVDGTPVVDLWAGVRDDCTGAPWLEDTRSILFSTSKGLVAIAMALLVDRGALDLEAPVARYWPEFAAGGKEGVTVRMVLDHTAGLPALAHPLTRAEVLAWTPVVEALAAQAPLWEPGHGQSYHPITYGFLTGEIVRRITGRPVAQFLSEEVGAPVNARVSLGVTAGELDGLARTLPPGPPIDQELADLNARDAARRPFFVRGLNLDGALPFPGIDEPHAYNDTDLRTAVVPGVNGFATARDLARVYAACTGPVAGRPRLVSEAAVRQFLRFGHRDTAVEPPQDQRHRWGAGFMVNPNPARPMLGPGSFGHDGADGSLGFGNLPHRVGFGYVTNQMGAVGDQRADRLTEALAACLEDVERGG